MAAKKKGAVVATRSPAEAAKVFKNLWDVRVLGAVSPRLPGCERTCGAIQIPSPISVLPIHPQRHTMTRVAGGTDDAGVVDKQNMGGRSYIPHAVYVGHLTLQPRKAAINGTTPQDLREFWDGLLHGWADARSSNRTQVDLRRLVVFEYASNRGAAEIRLRSAATVKAAATATSWTDYTFGVDLDVVRSVGADVNVYVWEDGVCTKNGQPCDWLDLPSDPTRRFIGVYAIDCVNSNPNGDPDDDGRPRMDRNGHGMIGYESIKRVVRDYVTNEYGHPMFIARGTDLQSFQDDILSGKWPKEEKEEEE